MTIWLKLGHGVFPNNLQDLWQILGKKKGQLLYIIRGY